MVTIFYWVMKAEIATRRGQIYVTFSSVALSRNRRAILHTLTKNDGVLKMKSLANRTG